MHTRYQECSSDHVDHPIYYGLDLGEERVRGSADACFRGEAAAARAAGSRGEGRGPGTVAGYACGCVHSCWL